MAAVGQGQGKEGGQVGPGEGRLLAGEVPQLEEASVELAEEFLAIQHDATRVGVMWVPWSTGVTAPKRVRRGFPAPAGGGLTATPVSARIAAASRAAASPALAGRVTCATSSSPSLSAATLNRVSPIRRGVGAACGGYPARPGEGVPA